MGLHYVKDAACVWPLQYKKVNDSIRTKSFFWATKPFQKDFERHILESTKPDATLSIIILLLLHRKLCYFTIVAYKSVGRMINKSLTNTVCLGST